MKHPLFAILTLSLCLTSTNCSITDPTPSPGSQVDSIPREQIVEITPKRERRAKIHSSLQAGQSLTRDLKLEIEVQFPPGQGGADNLRRSRTHRHRLTVEHVLEANQGIPKRIRREYQTTMIQEAVERIRGEVSRVTSNPLAGAILELTAPAPNQVKIESSKRLPFGTDTDELANRMVLDVISLHRFLPTRTVARGESWQVSPDAIVDLFGRAPPGCNYSGTISVTYERMVRYQGEQANHLGLDIRIEQLQHGEAFARYRKETQMELRGSLYYSHQRGQPLFVQLNGPIRIDYTPVGDSPNASLKDSARCAGQLFLSINFRSDPASTVR